MFGELPKAFNAVGHHRFNGIPSCANFVCFVRPNLLFDAAENIVFSDAQYLKCQREEPFAIEFLRHFDTSTSDRSKQPLLHGVFEVIAEVFEEPFETLANGFE